MDDFEFEKNLKKYFLIGIVILIFSGALVYISFVSINYKFITNIFQKNIKVNNYQKTLKRSSQKLHFILEEIKYQNSVVENKSKELVKANVYKAYKMVDNLYKEFHNKMPLKDLEKLISNSLLALRDRDNYIFAGNLKGYNKANPRIPMNTYLYNFQDIQGKYIVRDMIHLAKTKGEGFIEYYWYKPDNIKKYIKKVAFIKLYKPLGWYIGNGFYYDDMKQLLQTKILNFIKRIEKLGENYSVAQYTNNKLKFIYGASINFPSNTKIFKVAINKPNKILNIKTKKNIELFYVCYPDWEWIIFYKVDFNKYIEMLNKEIIGLRKYIFNNIIFFFSICLILSIIAVWLGYLFINRVVNSILKYKNNLKNKELFQKRLIDTIPAPLVVKSPKGEFLDCNKEFEKFFGIKEEELINLNEKEDLPFELSILNRMIIADIALKEIPKVSQIELHNKDGELRNLLLHKSFFKDLEGNIVGIIVVLFDVTEIKKLEEHFKNQAIKDELTRIFNRRYFRDILLRELKKFKRYGKKFSLVMFDIDHFKKINDTYGHVVGDSVLKELTNLIYKNIRQTDIFCRVGGEEFVIIAIFTELDEAVNLAEKLRKQVENFNFNEVGKVTISLGVTEVKKEDTFDSLTTRVDTALYNAKNNGRNRVEYL